MIDDAYLATLTQHEKLALQSVLNLSDGHAHHSPSARHREILKASGKLFSTDEKGAQKSHEAYFLSSYFKLALGVEGREDWIRERTHICYSASSAMEIVANVLRLAQKPRTLVLEPTFDNIPNILRRHGADVLAISDASLANNPEIIMGLRPDALVVVAPNNPTGRSFSIGWFEEIARLCRQLGTTLVIDYAFRFFDPTMRWDQYALLDRLGVSYLAIEDLGKVWPTQDLKVGILTSSANLYAPVEQVHDDFLLNVSPITLQLLTAFINAAQPENVLGEIRSISLTNRAELGPLLDRGFVDETHCGSISVAWMRSPSNVPVAVELCARARDVGVHILPGSPFFFANPAEGLHYIRIALMRDQSTVREGCFRLAACL